MNKTWLWSVLITVSDWLLSLSIHTQRSDKQILVKKLTCK